MAKRRFRWAPTPVNILCLLLSLLFLAAGSTKLLGMEMQVKDFRGWGYPDWFMYLTGVLEVLGAILLFPVRTRMLGALLLLAIMLGAMATHARAGEWLEVIFPLVLFLLLALVAWATRMRPTR